MSSDSPFNAEEKKSIGWLDEFMQYRISLSWNTEDWVRNLDLYAVSWCLTMAWHTFSQVSNTGVLFRDRTSVFRLVLLFNLSSFAMTDSPVFSIFVKFWFSNPSKFCLAKASTLLDFAVYWPLECHRLEPRWSFVRGSEECPKAPRHYTLLLLLSWE